MSQYLIFGRLTVNHSLCTQQKTRLVNEMLSFVQVQRKFNAVRENSMKDARQELKNIVKDTIKDIEQLNEPQPAVS